MMKSIKGAAESVVTLIVLLARDSTTKGETMALEASHRRTPKDR